MLLIIKLSAVALTATMDWRVTVAFVILLMRTSLLTQRHKSHTLRTVLLLLFPHPGYQGPDNVLELSPECSRMLS